MEEYITSTKNPLVKRLKMLHNKKYRDLYSQYLAEGPKIVKEALYNGEDIRTLAVSKDFPWEEFKEETGIGFAACRVLIMDEGLFKYVSDTKTPQGILAVISKKEYKLDEILKSDSYFLTILDEIRDPGNLGTIIRTVDAAGGDGVVLTQGCVDPYSPKVVRSSMGSILRVPVYQVGDGINFVAELLRQDVHVLVSHLKGSNLYDWPGGYKKTALVIGSESRGVRDDISKLASYTVKIPIYGRAESLNASVAAGILIYEVVRKSK
ncbi:MAG: RNA methyltransferase [Clostridiales bacterium]|jgi:TrmH family RNA methyltransferase|nr:RNA methyltransferase [Clostridiales bacterium]